MRYYIKQRTILLFNINKNRAIFIVYFTTVVRDTVNRKYGELKMLYIPTTMLLRSQHPPSGMKNSTRDSFPKKIYHNSTRGEYQERVREQNHRRNKRSCAFVVVVDIRCLPHS
jgi:hypothetical protein